MAHTHGRSRSRTAGPSLLAEARRVVVKVGSALLVDQQSGRLNRAWLEALAQDLRRMRKRGQQVILVSSGAIALGRRQLDLPQGALPLEHKQAAAAVGQIRLAHAYKELLEDEHTAVAQVLLTLQDSEQRRRYLNARATLHALLELGAVPVINENDTVATAEIRYGDNDRLAARVAQMASADCLVLLSDVDGLYSADPNLDPAAEFFPEVRGITARIEAMAGGSASDVGSGGMATKIAAARIALDAGCHMCIASGRPLNPLKKVEAGARCTWFIPAATPATARKQWIAGALKPAGILTIDAGAAAALGRGRSLLPAGVTAVTGNFERGDAVDVADAAGRTIARGLSAYSSADVARIMGRRSNDIEQLVGFRGRDEVVHRDDLVLRPSAEETGATYDMSSVKALEIRSDDLALVMSGLGSAAAASRAALALSSGSQRDAALLAAARSIRARAAEILAANAGDMEAARARGLSAAMLDRLQLNEKRVEAMAAGIEQIAALADPIGGVTAEWTRPNGLVIQRVRVPLGVIGIIYESRPNVTADAGALCLKSANPVILRGGSESRQSSGAIHACLVEGVRAAGLPEAAIQLVPTADRAAVGMMLEGLDRHINVIVPRGGRSLVERVQKEARVPVIGHLEGLCHVYVDREADADMARAVVLNAKLRRTGICGAAETLLVDRACAASMLPMLLDALAESGCELRGDATAQAADRRVLPATEQDWRTEYLDAIISIRTVDGVDEAIRHIATYGSAHTDSIVTSNVATAEKFLREVDSAIVLHNASTQFADGGEFGMGAEIGISTDRFHARGPVGVEQLASYKYVVRGNGQIRAG